MNNKTFIIVVLLLVMITTVSSDWYNPLTWFGINAEGEDNLQNNTSFTIVNKSVGDWSFNTKSFETDYDNDGIPDILSTFTKINETVIEINVTSTRDKIQSYKWASALCNVSNVNTISKEEYNPSTEVWTNTGALNYDTLTNFGLPSDWCGGEKGFILFGSGSQDKYYRLHFPEGAKEFTIFAGDGSEETIIEYQNISTIEYKTDYFNINVTLEEGNSNRTFYGTNYPEVLIIDSSKLKFGATRENATGNLEFRYTYESDEPLFKDNVGYYLKGKQTTNRGSKTIERNYLDVSDICYANSNFNSNCTYNSYSKIIGEENITHHFLEVYFTGEFTGNSTMLIDPFFTISSFTTIDSFDINVTSENNFSHLAISTESPYDTLVGYWTFDQNWTQYSDIIYDYSTNNIDGTATNGVVFNTTTCIYGNCSDYDGSSHYVDIGTNALLNPSNITVSTWIYSRDSDHDGGIVSRNEINNPTNDGWALRQSGTDLEFILDDSNSKRAVIALPSTNRWYHVLATYNGSQISLYINGTLVAIDESATAYTATSNSGKIGSETQSGSANNFFNGLIDEVMIFNNSLTASEISDIYNNQSARFRNPGNQTFVNFNVTAGNNTINVTTNFFSEDFDTRLETRIGFWELSDGYNDTFDGSGYTLSDGLVLYYHFDNLSFFGENDTHIADFSGNGNNASCPITCPTWVPEGRYNGTFDFTADTNIFMEVDNNPSLDIEGTAITLSAWIYPHNSGQGGGSRVISKRTDSTGSDVYSMYTSTSQLRFRLDGTDMVSTNTFNVNEWVHIVMVYDGVDKRIYWNGALDPTTPQAKTDNIDASARAVFLGTREDEGATRQFDGFMDEIRIWNRSLSAEEVAESYVKGRLNWNFLDFQNITHGIDNTFTINDTASFIFPEYKFFAGNDTTLFYTPILQAGIDFLSLNVTAAADTTPPTWSNNQTNSTIAGELVNFSIVWDDNTALNPNGQYVFSTNNTGVWINDSVINFTTTPETTNIIKTLNSTVGITVGYQWYANDSAGNNNNTDVFILNTTGGDNVFPQFTGFTETPTDPATYVFGQEYEFNTTVTSTNGTVLIDFDGINFTMTNLTIDQYNFTTTGLSAGTFNYVYYSWGNGTDENSNNTEIFSYTIDQANPLGSLTNSTFLTLTYPTEITIGLSESNQGDGDVTYVVFRDSIAKGTGETVTLPVGSFNYTLNTTGGTNYTANLSMDTFTLTINQNTSACSVLFNDTSPLTFPSQFIVFSDCTSSATLTRNGTSIANNSVQFLGAEGYNFTVVRDDTVNYTNTIDEEIFTIDQANPIGTIAGSTPITYNTAGDVEGSESNIGDSDVTYNLYRDSLLVSNPDTTVLAVGSYDYVFNTTGGANYTANASMDTFTLVVNQATPVLNLNITNSTFPIPGIINASEPNSVDGDVTYNLYQDGTLIGTGSSIDIEIEATGTFLIVYNTTGGANFTSGSNSSVLLVSQNTSACSVLFNDTSPLTYPSQFIVFTDCTSSFTLSRNGTAIANNSVQFLTAETYNFTVVRDDTVNYTNTIDEEIFTIDQANPIGTIAGSTPITYNTAGDVEGSESNTGDSDVTYNLYRDSLLVSNPDTTVLAVGSYDYVFNTTGGANYTANASMDTFTLVVNQATPVLNLNITNSTFPIPGIINASEPNSVDGDVTYNLYRNGTLIGTGSSIDIEVEGAGTYLIVYNTTGGTNFTSGSNLSQLLISQNAGACNVLFNDTSPLVFPNVFTVFTDCTSGFELFRNGTAILNNSEQALAVSEYNFTVTRNDTQNYTNIIDQEDFVISSQLDNVLNLTILPSLSEIYLTETNATCTATNGTPNLFRDDIAVSNPEVAILGANSYNYTCNITAAGDFVANQTSKILTINQATPVLNLNITNSTFPIPGIINASESNSVDGDVTYNLYQDGSLIGTGSSIDIEIPNAGTFLIVYNTSGGTNFSASSNSSSLFVFQNADTCNVLFNDTSPLTYPSQFIVFTDCTSSFTLTRNGTAITNNSIQFLTAETYNFTVVRDDTVNYTNTIDEEIFTINQAVPQGTLTGTTPITYPTAGDVEGTETNTGDSDVTYNLYRDSLLVSNPDTSTLAAGSYDYVFNTTGGANYTANASMDTFTLVVNQATPVLALNITNSTFPIPGIINATESNSVDGDVTYNLYRDGTLIGTGSSIDIEVEGAATYLIVYNTTGGTNFTSGSNSSQLLISQNAGACNVLFNETSPLVFPDVFTVFTDCTSGFELFRNGTAILNNSEQALAAGAYNFTVTRNDTQNYTNIIDEEEFVITAASTPPTFDNLVNQTIEVNESFTFDIDATAGSSPLDLFNITDNVNFTINSTTGVVINATLLIIFNYEMTVCINDTAGRVTCQLWSVNVTAASIFEDKIIQIWRNKGTGENVTTIDNQGNIITVGNINITNGSITDIISLNFSNGDSIIGNDSIDFNIGSTRRLHLTDTGSIFTGLVNVSGIINAESNLSVASYFFLSNDYSLPPGQSKILKRNSATKAVFGVQNDIASASTDSGAGYVLNTSIAEYRIDLHSALDLNNPNDTVHHILGASNREIWRLNPNSDSSFRFEGGLDLDIIIINRTGLFVTKSLIVGNSTSPQNITMFSPDGTAFSCGVSNDGTWGCT